MEEIIKRFLQVGSGDGYGDGYGYGSGYGYGYGSGYGSGSGSGSGSGDGSGDGDGYGDGSGDGSGSGDGDGSGVESINGEKVYLIDGTPTLIDSVHENYARGRILNSDLTTTDCYIAKTGDYFAHGETLRQALKGAAEKYENNLPVQERIHRFNSRYPDRDKKIPAIELFDWHHKLTGSCLMGRQQWCRSHGIDYENEVYTVNEFISLTKEAYGGEVIRQLEKSRS